MKKNDDIDNSLIKRKNLILMMRKKGIKNVSADSLDFLEEEIKKYLDNLTILLREEMTINGRKTLKKEDVKNVLNVIKTKKEETWEV